MESSHKKILKAVVLELRHLLEGWYDASDTWHPGDLEQRLAAIGVRQNRDPVPVDELSHLSDNDKHARVVVDAYFALRREAGIKPAEAVAEFVRETAYTWANRLLALRCMEARELIDEVILQKEVYGGRSLEHHRLAQRQPELCAGEDDGLFAVLDTIFTERAETLPLLFDPKSAGVALKPTAAALKRCVALLSGTESVNGQSSATDEVFKSADALGWAYQYYQTEEKKRVDDLLKTKKGFKCETPEDIAAKTALYTEPYMVKFLVQNSLGATWAGMRPDTRLTEDWEYFVRDADRAPVEKKPVREITFLDPACGSGHFLIEAFDLFYAMYDEEGELTAPEDICRSILENNLYGIDIDERAVQIAEAALWMKAAEKTFNFAGAPTNLIATNIRLPKGKDHLKAFLKQYPEDEALRPALEVIFEGLEHADELGSLLQIKEPVEKELRHLKAKYNGIRTHGGVQAKLFEPTIIQGKLPFGLESYDGWRQKTVTALKNHFAIEAESSDLTQAFFSHSLSKGLALFDLLSRQYDVVAANPPYMGAGYLGTVLKSYVGKHYETGKKDLFSVFILRCKDLTLLSGFVGMVTQQVWLFLRSYSTLRSSFSHKEVRRKSLNGILNETELQFIAHLGPRAFREISGEVVSVVLFTLRKKQPANTSRTTAFRLVNCHTADDKEQALLHAVQQPNHPLRFVLKQNSFLSIPYCPIVYWLPVSLMSWMESATRLSEFSIVTDGVTGLARLTRMVWEAPLNSYRWITYSKGGAHVRWAGLEIYVTDWEHEGTRQRSYIDQYYPYLKGNYGFRLKQLGILPQVAYQFSSFGKGGLGCRVHSNCIILGDKGPGVVPKDNAPRHLLSLLNHRGVNYLMRAIGGQGQVQYPYLATIPLPTMSENDSRILEILQAECISAKNRLVASNLTELTFRVPVEKIGILSEYIQRSIDSSFDASLILLLCEAAMEGLVFASYLTDPAAVDLIVSETGRPSGWLQVIPGYDQLRSLAVTLNSKSCEILKSLWKDNASIQGIDEIRNLLSSFFQAGPSTKASNDDDKQGFIEGCGITSSIEGNHIPSETFLDELSKRLNVNPISIYWLLKEGIEKEGWRCLPEERRIAADRFTVTILRLLGHRWPKQIEANEPIPDWADEDGIIPLTGGTSEQTLIERVRKRIAAEFEGGDVASIEREFTEIMGKTLEQWIETEFFKHHVKQFKKRPIAWQIQSGKYTRKKKPAFACLVYYHKLDGDLLPKIGAQYAGPLRQRYETELRGIEAVPIDARSDRQDKRRVELEGLIEELKEFESVLQKVAAEAFLSEKLETLIANDLSACEHAQAEQPDKWCSIDGIKEPPADSEAFLRQERCYLPDINDGVRVNITPLQKAGLLAANVLSKKDIDKAIVDRAQWRADERRWCREGKVPQPGWWQETGLD